MGVFLLYVCVIIGQKCADPLLHHSTIKFFFGAWNRTLTVYNLNGEQIKEFKNLFASSSSFAFDKNGMFYVASESVNAIMAYTENCQRVKEWECPKPRELRVANDQIVLWCMDRVICRYTLDGKLIQKWELENSPLAMAIYNDEIFFTVGCDVLVFSMEGTLLRKWGRQIYKISEYWHPTGIAVSEYSIYVLDSANSRVLVYNRDGEYAFGWNYPDMKACPIKLLALNSKLYVASMVGVYAFEVQ